MNLFFLILRSSWKTSLASVTLGGVSGVATLGLITLVHRALSDPAPGWSLPVTFAAACVAVLITQILAKCILVRLSQSTAARLQFELTTRILAAPLPDVESAGPNKLLSVIRGDVGTITGALTSFPSVCASAMVLVSGIFYLASLSVPLAICTVVMALAGIIAYLTGIRLANQILRQARNDKDEVNKQLRAMVDGIKELKANRGRCIEFVYDILLPADSVMRERLITGMDIQGAAHSFGRLALFVGIGLLLFVWPHIWPVSVETLTGYTLTILYLTSPLDSILGWLPAFHHATISLDKINELGLMIDPSDEPHVNDVPPDFQTIEMCGAVYTYESPDDDCGFRLGPCDLKLSAGEVLFVAGGNGSGKTTLAKLLTGLYPPHEGQLLLNGKIVDESSVGDFRQLFATVFVEGHLFDRLIGVRANRMELRYWVGLLGIEDKVDIETGRLTTRKLSRGQHKRLALLVACLDDRPIFVFDEWAAEQDPAFKEVFYRQIVPELTRRGRTVVAITHDDRYFGIADRVVKLFSGRLESDLSSEAA